MGFRNLCLRESLPFYSATPKRGPSLSRCSSSQLTARRQRALQLDPLSASDWWGRARSRQCRRPRSARCMPMDHQPAHVRISRVMHIDSVQLLTCATHSADLFSTRHLQRFLESQQEKQVISTMPVYVGVCSDNLKCRKLEI